MSGLYFQGGKHFSTKVVLNKKIKKYIYIYMCVCVCVCQLNMKPANSYVLKERFLFHKRM